MSGVDRIDMVFGNIFCTYNKIPKFIRTILNPFAIVLLLLIMLGVFASLIPVILVLMVYDWCKKVYERL